MLTTPRYADLKRGALSILYKEAVSAFASGARTAVDMVEAFERRHAG
jgi:hypothetical protein